jgi:uncharacterized protein
LAIDGSRNLFIAGGSVRAAAASAIRAGFTPWCVDCFGDIDLVRACPTRVVHDYPKAIPGMLASGPAGGWMYTGAMENHPEIIAAVNRPLYGNTAESVRLVRDPSELVRLLEARRHPNASWNFLESERAILKPRKSGGGIGIRFWNGEPIDWDRFYLQEWIDGEPMSAVILGGIGQSECVGQTQQLIGKEWLHAPGPFHYCGSIYRSSKSAEEIGSGISWEFGLAGLFGIDGIERDDGTFVPVEVNPRYTASVEILERATGRELLRDHLRHFVPFREELLPSATGAADREAYPGKAVLYAPVDFTFPAAGPWEDDYPFADLRRRFADLPHPGQQIRRGQPVLTFFADGDSPASTEAALRKIAGDLDRLLFGR